FKGRGLGSQGKARIVEAISLVISVALISGRDAMFIFAGESERDASGFGSICGARSLHESTEGSTLGGSAKTRSGIGTFRRDVDHSSDRVRSVEHTLRTSEYLYTLDVLKGEIGEVEASPGIHWIIDLDSVQQN